MKDLAVVISNDNEGVSPIETIDAIYKSGFRNVFIQWYEGDYKKFDISQEEQLKYARSLGLNVIFSHLGYRGINNIWLEGEEGDKLVEKYKNDIKTMKDSNIPLVVMHICVGYDAPNVSLIGLKRWKSICEYAKSIGMNIAFENTKMPGYQEYMLNNINMDNISICFDSGHMHCHFKDDYNFKQFKDKISCVHIHDNHGEKDEHLIPGDGTLDMDYVLNGLHEANYNEYFTLELCYRKEYLSIGVDEFYKKGYDKGMKLKRKYEEIK